MSKLTINVGQAANDKTGDTLRVAFSKINQNFTELFATDTSTKYHLGDDTQFVRIELDGEGVPTGGITIQSGFDTAMPVYIKGANAMRNGAGGNVIIEAGAPPLATPEQLIQGGLPYDGTVGDIEIAGNQTTIYSLGNTWTFGADGKLTFPDATTTTGKSITISTGNSLTVNLSNSSPSVNTTFKINPLSIKLPTGNGAIFSGVDGDVAYLWALDATNKTFYFPDAGDLVYPQIRYSTSGGDGMQLVTSSKPIKITASAKSWSFNTDGKLTLPSGGTVSYTPATSTDWNGTAPTTIQEAIDRLAAAFKILHNGTGA